MLNETNNKLRPNFGPAKTMRRLAASIAIALAPTLATADFLIEGAPTLSSESGQGARYSPPTKTGGAAFRVVAPDGNKPAQERYKNAELLVDLAYTPVTERGTGIATQVVGFADDVPFASAMSMIVPRGWHIYRDASLPPKTVPELVSFTGNKSWPEVLRTMGDRHTLHFHIDWYDRTVMLKKGRPAPAMHAANIQVIEEPKPVHMAAGNAGTGAGSAAKSTGAGSAVQGSKGVKAGDPNAVAVAFPAGQAPKSITAPAKPPKPVVESWSVTVSDQTLREALSRWSRQSKWTFEPEHWAVPVDIPLTANATFRGDFKSAVQQIVATTELSETPLQPCFYSNKVVRVVPYNEMCDRMSAR